MLCLSRRGGEKIKIGDNVYVQIVEVSGGKVRLGIDAPKEVAIWRTELLGPDGKPLTARVVKEPPMLLKGGLD